MVQKIFTFMILAVAFSMTTGCATQAQKQEELSKMLAANPDILVKAIEANPTEILTALQSASKKAQASMAKQQKDLEQKALAEAYEHPLNPKIRDDESIRGAKSAVLTLVEYSDFQCPFCSRGTQTVHALLKKYDGKIRLVFKHLPLEFHAQAQISAQYYEAIRLQSEQKAFQFHDEVFENQKNLSEGKAFLNKIAQKIKVDMKKLAVDIESKKVKDRIEEDKIEAANFEMQGTPGFVLNGIPVRGAYPIEHFENIIAELKKRGQIKADL